MASESFIHTLLLLLGLFLKISRWVPLSCQGEVIMFLYQFNQYLEEGIDN